MFNKISQMSVLSNTEQQSLTQETRRFRFDKLLNMNEWKTYFRALHLLLL